MLVATGFGLLACGEDSTQNLRSQDGSMGAFDRYCLKYKDFPAPDGEEIRYTIDRILFAAGLSGGATAENCRNASGALASAIYEPANPARPGRQRAAYIFRLGVRKSAMQPNLWEADPGEKFQLKNLKLLVTCILLPNSIYRMVVSNHLRHFHHCQTYGCLMFETTKSRKPTRLCEHGVD